MNVEIINVGTELLLGEIVNTNATLLQKMCKDLGFNVYFQTVVGDNPERLYDCLKLAFDRGADCVMTTGGLGPTSDDLTKELSAQYLDLDMVYNEMEAKKVEEKCKYCSSSSTISSNNFKQAYYPADAYILENDMGTANGCVMQKDGKMIVNLPGPPKEIQYVIEHSLLPYLSQYKQETIFTIALYAGEETVRIRLAVKTHSQQQADQMMETTKTEIEKRIGQYMIAEKDLKEALLKKLPSLSIEYKGTFQLKDEFLKPFFSIQPQIRIVVETRQEKLGEVVVFKFNDDYVFKVPTFVKARYSYGKVEARFVAQLYKYLLSQK